MAALGSMVLSYVDGMPELEGMSLPDARELSPGEALCSLFVETPEGRLLGDAARQRRAVASGGPRLDGAARAAGLHGVQRHHAGVPHPRSFGAYPRFLGRLRRRVGGLSLEAMVHRMTDRPARRFGIMRRGRIEKGYYADLVVFDPDRVIDTATYDDPRRFPIGIPACWSTAPSTARNAPASWPGRAVAQPSGISTLAQALRGLLQVPHRVGELVEHRPEGSGLLGDAVIPTASRLWPCQVFGLFNHAPQIPHLRHSREQPALAWAGAGIHPQQGAPLHRKVRHAPRRGGESGAPAESWDSR